MKNLIIVICSVLTLSVATAASKNASYALECLDTSSQWHLKPLSFYEYSDELGSVKILPDYLNTLPKLAPMVLKGFRDYVSQTSLTLSKIDHPAYEHYDPIVSPPKECNVITMVTKTSNSSKNIVANEKYWNQLDETYKQFFLFDLKIQNYLKNDLNPYGFRRFSVFTASNAFYNLSTREKMDFFKYHGINEFQLDGISIHLDKEILFYLDTDIIREAYPFTNATFRGAALDPEKFISFSKNEKMLALATLTPFKMLVNNQEFEFFIPKNSGILNNAADLMRGPYDVRTNSRFYFFENGKLEIGFVKLVKNFFDKVTNIQARKLEIDTFIEIHFYNEGQPRYFWVRPFYYLSYGSGEIVIENKKYRAMRLSWNKNGTYSDVSLIDGHGYPFKKLDGTTELYLSIYFDKNGHVAGGRPR